MNRVLNSLKNAFFGLKYCFITQRNMVIHAIFGSVVIVVGVALKISMTEMIFLLAAVFLVLVAEAFNTALEKTIDLYTKERNHLAHIAKDVAAGAVLLTSIYAVIIGLIILGPPLWKFISTVFN